MSTRDTIQRLLRTGFGRHRRNDLGGALSAYRQVLQLDRNNYSAAYLSALALYQGRQTDAAVALLAACVQRNDADANAWYNLGKFLGEAGRLREAYDALLFAHQRDPQQLEAVAQLGWTSGEMGLVEESEDWFTRALAMGPTNPTARYNVSFIHLARGDYGIGWPLYESRWQCEGFLVTEGRPDLSGERWDGAEPLGRQTLLIHHEQGAGDVIQFARFLVTLRAEHPDARLILQAPSVLTPLFEGVACLDQVITGLDEIPPHDTHCAIASLPMLTGHAEGADTPPPIAYLGGWRGPTPGGLPRRIGLVWGGSPTHRADRRRSLPVELFQSLTLLPGAELVSLQVGARADEADVLGLPRADFADYGATARALRDLDLVISCDTSVAHLAASMGVPTWLLLQAPAEFRWGRTGDRTHWYPSARLFRQEVPGQWGPVIARLLNALTEWSHTA